MQSRFGARCAAREGRGIPCQRWGCCYTSNTPLHPECPVDITPQEMEMLRYFVRFNDQHGRPPTVEELCAALSYSTTTEVETLVTGLISGGWLRRRDTGSKD